VASDLFANAARQTFAKKVNGRSRPSGGHAKGMNILTAIL